MTEIAKSQFFSLIGGASLPLKANNEDAFAVLENNVLGIRAIMVADGVHSSERAGEASHLIIERLSGIIKGAYEPLDLSSVYLQLQGLIDEEATNYQESISASRTLLASTLISAVEQEKFIDIAYIGNGAIWHLRGNFDQFHESRYIPWNALNYLNPHTNPDQTGRESLYKCFAAGAKDSDVLPTTLRLSKDERYGDIIMICTDGVYSYDQLSIGKISSNNSIWIPAEPMMLRFFSSLKKYFSDLALTSKILNNTLYEFLSNANHDGLLDDDATIAVLITGPAIKYQSNKTTEKAFG